MQPEPCPLCGLHRAQDCENCWDEELDKPCEGCRCDCLCDETEVTEWNRAAAEEDERRYKEEADGCARYDLMTGEMK